MNKLKTNYSFKFELPIYPMEIIVSVGQSIQDAQRIVDRLELTHKQRSKMQLKEPNGWLCSSAPGMDRILITIPDPPELRADWIACLQHECFHATEYVFNYIGSWHDESSSEPFAYLQSYIFEKILLRTCGK